MLTIPQTAARLGISPGSVRALIRAGRLPYHRPTLGGRRIVLDEADVVAYLEATRVQEVGKAPAPRRPAVRRYRCEIL